MPQSRVLACVFCVFGLLLNVAACRTAEKKQGDDASTAFNQIDMPSPADEPLDEKPIPPRPECPVPETVCSSEYSPVFCSALSYDGQELASDAVYVAWGKNVCDGKLKLARLACERQKLPSKLERAQCVPDASNDHCPVSPPICTAEFKPVVCTAHVYAGQPLQPDQLLTSPGSNACVARGKLEEQACRRNLDPKLMDSISCVDDE